MILSCPLYGKADFFLLVRFLFKLSYLAYMLELITLEGDKVFPAGTDIVSVTGKFYPKESIDGQLFGTLVVDSSIVKYPYINQLNGSDTEDISLNGDFVVDGFSLPIDKEIYPDVTLSGDEFLNGFSFGRGFGRGLGRSFGGLSKGLSRMGRGLSRSGRSLSRGLAKSTQSVSKGLSRTGQSLSRGVSAYGKSLGKFYSGIGRGLGRAGTQLAKGLGQVGSQLTQGIGSIVTQGQGQPQEEEEQPEEQLNEDIQSQEEESDEQISEGEAMNDNFQNEEIPENPPEINGWGDIAQGLSNVAGKVNSPYGQVASLGLNILSQFDNNKKPSQNAFDILQKLRTVPKKSKPVIVKKPNGQTSIKMKTGTPNFRNFFDACWWIFAC